MQNIKKILCVLIASLFVFSSFGVAAFANDEHTEHDICHPNPVVGTKGTFNALNYNVDGYPIPASETEDGKDAFEDSFIIGEKLNALNYDVVAIQDDYNYDKYLRSKMTSYANKTDAKGNVTARHQSVHSGMVPLGDGLNIFTKYYMYNDERQLWNTSAGMLGGGNDQVSYKGVQVTTIELAKGYYLDVYNVDIDAYTDTDSIVARRSQFTQLAEFIMKHSVYDETTGTYDHAVLVTGDFNANIFSESEKTGDLLVSNLLEVAHLNDAWAVKTIDAIEEYPETYDAYYDYAEHTEMSYDDAFGHYDSGERFCYTAGNGIKISCLEFGYTKICDDNGRSLSDHYAAYANFEWEIVEKSQDTGHNHDSENVAQEENVLIRFLNYIASIFRAIGKFFQDYKNWFA